MTTIKKFKTFLALSVVAGLIYGVGWSTLFAITSVEVTGAPTVATKQLVLNKIGFTSGDNLARIPPHEVEGNVEKIGWVLQARVSRDWLNKTLAVTVLPRTPIAIYKGVVIDRYGVRFQSPTAIPTPLPQLVAASPQLGVDAYSLLRTLPLAFRKKITRIEVRPGTNYFLTITEDEKVISLIWGDNDVNPRKVQVYEFLRLRLENKDATQYDLSSPNSPVVK